MRKMPAYYRETKAWMNAVEKARVYADYNHHPLLCWTDHIPLTYLKHTSGKGPVALFHLENLSYVDYEIRYRKGVEISADHVSRFPLLGPRELTGKGVQEAVKILLASLPSTFFTTGKVWMNAGKETRSLRDCVAKWQNDVCQANKATGKIKVVDMDRPTPKKISVKDYEFGIWTPPAETTEPVIVAAIQRGKPFACLAPSCLIPLIQAPEEIRKEIEATMKIVLLEPELTWVIGGVENMEHQVMAAWGVHTLFEKGEDEHGLSIEPLNWDNQKFVKAQEQLVKEYEAEHLFVRDDGFVMYKPDADTDLIIVPGSYREELTMWQHRRMCHVGAAKVYAKLARTFHWPGMKGAVRKWVIACNLCQELKAKRKCAHQHFRAKVCKAPRTSYGMDFYTVAESEDGYRHILGLIDLASSVIRLFPTKRRTAGITQGCLLHGVFLRDGVPLNLHSDHAREFVSKAVKRICELLGCNQTTTLAHHPTGNATIERLWRFVTLVLRQMNKKQYRKWDRYIRLIEHTWNTTVHTLLGVSPFEAAHGLPARSATEMLASARVVNTRNMDEDDIAAMQTTAKALVQAMVQLRTFDKRERAEKANQTRSKQTFKLGDKVLFFIPPDQKQVEREGRKAKHLMQYRGPAVIVKVRTPTTYSLTYKGRLYHRATGELRKKKKKKSEATMELQRPESHDMESLKVGQFVLYRDDQETDCLHLGKIKTLGDFVELETWATSGANIKTAQWKPLYQIAQTGQYTVEKNAKRVQTEVLDKIPLEEQEGYIIMTNVKLGATGKLKGAYVKEMHKKKMRHHKLGKTFP